MKDQDLSPDQTEDLLNEVLNEYSSQYRKNLLSNVEEQVNIMAAHLRKNDLFLSIDDDIQRSQAMLNIWMHVAEGTFRDLLHQVKHCANPNVKLMDS